jgi:hypothetical protein
MRPRLGLLGTKWTLADRVAGLLDMRRIPMTRSPLRIKLAIPALLAMLGLIAANIRLDPSARAQGTPAKPPEVRASTTPTVWRVEGTVVDERGPPVAGAVVRAIPDYAVKDESKTTADGSFALTFGGRHQYISGVIAETDGGAQIGLVRFEDGRRLRENGALRIVMKPSRVVTVLVIDATALPVIGAAVEAIEPSFRTNAMTDPQGTATLRVAAAAKVQWVTGLKAESGYDYFENYRTFPAADFPPLPEAVTLRLDGAETVRVKAVDTKGQSVSGVRIGPVRLFKSGKIWGAGVGRWETTDHDGFATFDWLPKGAMGPFSFRIGTKSNYSCPDISTYQRGGPSQLTAELVRDTRLSGIVRFPDGRPAPRLLVEAEGGARAGASIRVAARTLGDGSYSLEAPSESCYMISVVDETWAAPSLSNIIVRESHPQSGLDLTLSTGTFLHGQVIEPSDERPVAGAVVDLIEEAGPLPKELRGSDLRPALLDRTTHADSSGKYHFRVGPGQYNLRSRNAGGTERLTLNVKHEAEIVIDIALKGPSRETYLSGVVIEKTPNGDRPVARARVSSLRAGFPGRFSIADEQRRFRLMRVPGEWYLYGDSRERSLGGFMRVTAGADNVTLVVSKAPTITGRVIDSAGKPQSARYVGVRIDTGPDVVRAGRRHGTLTTDEQGRYELSAVSVGSFVELSVSHQRDPAPNAPATVVRLEVVDTDPVVIPDLIVPAANPTR